MVMDMLIMASGMHATTDPTVKRAACGMRSSSAYPPNSRWIRPEFPAGAVGAVAPRSSASSISMASSVDSMILPRSRRMDGAPMQSGHRRAICAHMVLG